MTVTAQQCIEPIGDLSVAFFPSDDEAALQARVSHWIVDAGGQIPNPLANTPAYDRAVMAWVYHRAYRLVWLRLSRDPATAMIAGEGSSTITGEQIRTFKHMTEAALATYNEIVASVGDTALTDAGSGAIPTAISW